MKNFLYFSIGLIFGAAIVFGYFSYNINKESTSNIDKEITNFKEKISALDIEIAKYKGGLLPTILTVQRAIYSETVASLELKKTQIFHLIKFNYSVPTDIIIPAGNTESYEKEIAELEKKIAEDQKESEKYRPCLIKSLIETRIAQTRLTLSGLERAKIAKQYNLPFLSIATEKAPQLGQQEQNQTPEADKEAL